MMDTYLDNSRKASCTGCSACVQVCGKGAMHMEYDAEGFAYPVIDREKCVNCGLCRAACPMTKDLLYPKVERVTGGYVYYREVLEKSTSGGAFTALVKAWCTGSSYAVFGAAQTEKLTTEHRYITDLSDLDMLRKSKYDQSRIGTAYADCKRLLSEGRKVVFTGTPCQISGLRAFLGDKEYPELLTIDVICEGVPSPKYKNSFIKYMEEKHASSVKTLDYRDKDGGRWDYNVMSLTFENGKHITIDRWVNPFFDIWMQHIMSRLSCYECRYTTSRRCSDITLGDLWGVHIFCPELYNDNHGSSVMIPSTEKGRTAIELAKQQMTTRELDMDTVVKYANRMRDPIAMNERREEFLSDLDKMEFKRIKRKWMRRPPLKLLIKKYIYGTNRQVVRKYLKKQAHRKGQK